MSNHETPMTIDWISALWENTLTAEEIAGYLQEPSHVEQLRVQARKLWRRHAAEERVIREARDENMHFDYRHCACALCLAIAAMKQEPPQ